MLIRAGPDKASALISWTWPDSVVAYAAEEPKSKQKTMRRLLSVYLFRFSPSP